MTAAETVLVTGASSGIGLELARCFAADGSRLVLVARRRDRLDRLAAECRAAGSPEVVVLPADLARPEAPDDLFEACANRSLAVDVLVNNAGIGLHGPFATADERRTLDMLRINIEAVTRLARRFLPPMLQRRRGGLLNVASTAAFQPGPLLAVYYATKAYVLHWSEALSEETRGTGVTVSCLCPGPTHTEFVTGAGMENSRMFDRMAADAPGVARAGHRGFRRGRTIVIPGLSNRLGALGSKLAPRWVARRATKMLNESGRRTV